MHLEQEAEQDDNVVESKKVEQMEGGQAEHNEEKLSVNNEGLEYVYGEECMVTHW